MSDLDGFEYREFARRPFTVEAMLVTVDNLEVIAPHVGDVVHKEDGTKYIQVDRRKVPNVFRVWPGFYLTRMDGNIRCYSAKEFFKQFVELDETTAEFVTALSNGEGGE